MTRARALQGARLGFLLLALACAGWGFRGRWSQIGDAIAATGGLRLALAVLCAAAGLALTGLLWSRLLTALGRPAQGPAQGPAHGPRVGLPDAAAVFFVGQLGKYVPGSVWSFAAQAELGRRHGVPVRSSVTASALFLLVHTASGLLLGGLLVAAGAGRTGADRGWWPPVAVGGAVAGAVLLAPPVLRLLGDRLAGAGVRTRFGGGDLVRSLGLMAAVWACYGASVWAVLPALRPSPGHLATAVAAFALAHAAGVLLVVAPAGLGAREAVLVALLAPLTGVPAAAAAALLVRVAHAVADVALAAGAAAWARQARDPEVVGVGGA